MIFAKASSSLSETEPIAYAKRGDKGREKSEREVSKPLLLPFNPLYVIHLIMTRGESYLSHLVNKEQFDLRVRHKSCPERCNDLVGDKRYGLVPQLDPFDSLGK